MRPVGVNSNWTLPGFRLDGLEDASPESIRTCVLFRGSQRLSLTGAGPRHTVWVADGSDDLNGAADAEVCRVLRAH